MLIITRKENQSFHVNGDARITILSAKGGTLRIGIEADKSVSVMREEVLQRVEASGDSPETLLKHAATFPGRPIARE